jgi:glutathione S-transferase
MSNTNLTADLTEELAIVRALIAKSGNPPLTRAALEQAEAEQRAQRTEVLR